MLRAACLNVAYSGGFVDACLSATLSSVLLNVGGAAPFILACLVEGSLVTTPFW